MIYTTYTDKNIWYQIIYTTCTPKIYIKYESNKI